MVKSNSHNSFSIPIPQKIRRHSFTAFTDQTSNNSQKDLRKNLANNCYNRDRHCMSELTSNLTEMTSACKLVPSYSGTFVTSQQCNKSQIAMRRFTSSSLKGTEGLTTPEQTCPRKCGISSSNPILNEHGTKNAVIDVHDNNTQASNNKTSKETETNNLYASYNRICRRKTVKNASSTFKTQYSGGGLQSLGWQATKSNLKERMVSMLMNGTFADIFFIFRASDGSIQERIPAHKFVLSIGSSVFEAMFRYDSQNEKGCSNCIQEIEPSDVELKAFIALLSFLYTDDVNISADYVMSILYAAKKYGVPSLERLCVNFLEVNLCTENSFMLLSQARLFDEDALAHHCFEIIDRNCSEAMNTEAFVSIDIQTLISVLRRDSLIVDELFLFKRVLQWAKEACKRHKVEISAEKLRDLLKEALFLIRFPLLTPEDFANEVVPLGLLTDSEIVSVFMHHFKKPIKHSRMSSLLEATHNQKFQESKEPANIEAERQNRLSLMRPITEANHTKLFETKFPCHQRGCLIEKELTVNRFQRVEASWGYSGTPDRIKFAVDTVVLILGFGLYGSTREPFEYPVTIEIINFATGKTLAKHETSFLSDGSSSIFRVMFEQPVEISAGITYIASAKLSGNKESYYGSKGLRRVVLQYSPSQIGPSYSSPSSSSSQPQPLPITWQFSYAAGNNNGTSVDDGQIPEIIFSPKRLI